MSKNQKSKNYAIAKLYKILDFNSKKDIQPQNEKYLGSLNQRLKEISGEEVIYQKKIGKQSQEDEIDVLKPKVVIHAREVKKEPEVPKLKIDEKRRLEFEDEEVFEIKKIKIKEPEFIEVKPKGAAKEEIIEIKDLKPEEKKLPAWESIEVQKKDETFEEIPEMEPVSQEEIKKPEPFTKLKVEEKKVEEEINFCPECGTKLVKSAEVCSNCGTIIKAESIPSFIPIKKLEKEYEPSEWEQIEVEKPKEEIITLIKKEEKILIFKDLKSIDEKTAILLYDNGITTIDLLKKSTIKDLTKIKGIKKKTAKKIKKELDEAIIKSGKVRYIEVEEFEKDEQFQVDEKIEEKTEEWESPEEITKETSVWEPIEEKEKEKEEKEAPIFEEFIEEKVIEKPIIDDDSKIEVFSDVKSIDNKTAVLLFDKGYTTIDALNKAPLKDLTKIKGIKRKTAKKIKKELEQPKTAPIIVPIPEVEEKTKTDNFQQIQQELATSKKQLKTITKDLNKKEKDIQKLQEGLDEKIKELETKKTEIYNRDEEIKLLQDQSEQNKQDLQTGNLELNKKQEEIEQLQKQLEDKTINLEAINSELGSKDEEIKLLQKQTEQNKQTLETEKIEINKKQQEIEQLQKQLEDKTINLDAKSFELGSKDEEIKQLQEQLEEKTKELETENLELNIKDKEIEKIKKDLQTKTEEINEKQQTITELKTQLSDRQKELDRKDKEIKINIFRGIKSIDEETAVLLYDNGITTVESLINISQKDLAKIKGVKRKNAKKIKKELEQKQDEKIVKELKPEIEEKPVEYVAEKKVKKEPKKEKVERKTEYLGDENNITKEEAREIDKKISDEFSLVVMDDDIFNDINSIDEKTSILLKENGITSLDALKNASVKDLAKIKGIKRKTAKQIKKEIKNLPEKEIDIKSKQPFKQIEEPTEEEAEWEYYDEHLISDSTMKEYKGFKHGDYTLYEREIATKSGKKRTVRFFSKAEPEDGQAIDLPKGYEVKENKKTGLPYLRKKK